MAHRLSVNGVCRLIISLFPFGYPTIEVVAGLLGVSSRTLQRRLKQEAVSYSGLVERCRCQVACESLRHTLIPAQDIAVSLGYRDVSSFSRAFRRWVGVSPRAYRNQFLNRSVNQPDTSPVYQWK